MVENNKDMLRFCLVLTLLLHIGVYWLAKAPSNDAKNEDVPVIQVAMISRSVSANQMTEMAAQSAQAQVADMPSLPMPKPPEPAPQVVKETPPPKDLAGKKPNTAVKATEQAALTPPSQTNAANTQAASVKEMSDAAQVSNLQTSAGQSEAAEGELLADIPLISTPQYRHSQPPEYPPQAVAMGYEGTVLVHVLVGTGGETREVKVAHSSGYSILDEAAVLSVRKWEFEPYQNNGKLMLSWVAVPVQFKLNN